MPCTIFLPPTPSCSRHQFPPVAQGSSEPLYYPTIAAKDSVDMQIGRSIYEEFDIVVVLREQVRCTDSVWHQFLQRLRFGRVEETDLSMLHASGNRNGATQATSSYTALYSVTQRLWTISCFLM